LIEAVDHVVYWTKSGYMGKSGAFNMNPINPISRAHLGTGTVGNPTPNNNMT